MSDTPHVQLYDDFPNEHPPAQEISDATYPVPPEVIQWEQAHIQEPPAEETP